MIRKIKDLLYFSTALLLSFFLKLFPANRDIWVITERKAECKDNGYYLFKYIREHCPEKKVYYAITKDSDQIWRIKEYGNVLWFNGFKHYLYSIMASRLIGAFLPCGIPDSVCFYKFPKMIHGKKIFLQHGITMGNIQSLMYDNTSVELFVCAAKPEYDFVSSSFGYPEGNVKLTGFCRFDGLFDCEISKQILLMPTWRKWIPSATWNSDERIDPDDYEYFVRFKSLVNNARLKSLLDRTGYKLVFFLHHEMQPYVDYFEAPSDIVTIATEKDYNVQDLLKSCSMLITDYSSVQFDVAYMHKPIIYYQFDEQKYYSEHYQKGYYDYDTMGFGKKCTSESDLIDEIEKVFEQGLQMKEPYSGRIGDFFGFFDQDNCARVFDAIREIK